MDNNDFKKHAHQVLDWMADYFKKVESYPVQSSVKPKDIYKQLQATAPDEGESFETIFDDFKKIIMPGMTHFPSILMISASWSAMNPLIFSAATLSGTLVIKVRWTSDRMGRRRNHDSQPRLARCSSGEKPAPS